MIKGKQLAPDKNYFVGAIGNGDGTATFFSLGQSFSTVPLNSISDPAGKWNGTNKTWEIPVTGLYQIDTKIRALDDLDPLGFGHGAHTSNSDGSWFLWDSVRIPIGGGATRSGSLNSRTAVFTAGDLIRMYGYADVSGSLPCAAAEMTIVLLKAS